MKTTHALDIRMQCAGFLSGLQTADAFIRSGMYDRILLVGAEVHSGLMPWPEEVWDVMLGKSPGPCDPLWYERATGMRDRAVLFGDGAGAMVLEANDVGRRARPPRASRCTRTASTGTSSTCRAAAASRGPTSRPRCSRTLGTIPIVEGRQVFRLATQLMPAAVLEVLAGNGRTLDDVDLLLMHQANLRINEAAQKVLGLPGRQGLQQHPEVRQHDRRDASDRVPRGEARGQGERRRPRRFTALGAGLHWGAGLAVV